MYKWSLGREPPPHWSLSREDRAAAGAALGLRVHCRSRLEWGCGGGGGHGGICIWAEAEERVNESMVGSRRVRVGQGTGCGRLAGERVQARYTCAICCCLCPWSPPHPTLTSSLIHFPHPDLFPHPFPPLLSCSLPSLPFPPCPTALRSHQGTHAPRPGLFLPRWPEPPPGWQETPPGWPELPPSSPH